MIKNFFTSAIVILMAIFSFVSCTQDYDNPDYASTLPIISEVRVSPNPVIAGKQFTVTIVQSKKGQLLNMSKYTWDSNMYNLLDKKPSYLKKLIYDNNNENPEMVMMATQTPGTYSLNFKASYSNVGNHVGGISGTTYLENGTNVTYTLSALTSYLNISTTIFVKKATN